MCTQLIVVSKLRAPIWTYDIPIQLLEQRVHVCLYLSNVIFILLMYVCVSQWHKPTLMGSYDNIHGRPRPMAVHGKPRCRSEAIMNKCV